jgi:hypothetical protein
MSGLPGGGLVVVGLVGGELAGQEFGAVVAEDVLVEEGFQGGHEGVFADGHGRVVGVGGAVPRVGHVVRALVVDQGGAGGGRAPDAAHAPLADPAPDPRPEDVPAARPGGGHLRVADVAALHAYGLGLLPGGPVHDGGVDGSGGPDPLLGRHRPGLALASLLAGAAEDHVARVLGIGQDRGHGGLGPPAGAGGG